MPFQLKKEFSGIVSLTFVTIVDGQIALIFANPQKTEKAMKIVAHQLSGHGIWIQEH